MRVLAVVAHPDDEVLGPGGTLAKHAEARNEVALSVGTNDRLEERTKAADVLGLSLTWTHTFGMPDQRFEQSSFQAIIRVLESFSGHFAPEIVYTHSPDELNLDHQIISRAVLTALRPHRFKGTILAFETLSSTEWGIEPFQANWWEELSEEQLQKKIAALDCYRSQIRPPPHPRNIEGVQTLARFRGSQAGVRYAEAFRLLRRGPG